MLAYLSRPEQTLLTKGVLVNEQGAKCVRLAWFALACILLPNTKLSFLYLTFHIFFLIVQGWLWTTAWRARRPSVSSPTSRLRVMHRLLPASFILRTRAVRDFCCCLIAFGSESSLTVLLLRCDCSLLPAVAGRTFNSLGDLIVALSEMSGTAAEKVGRARRICVRYAFRCACRQLGATFVPAVRLLHSAVPRSVCFSFLDVRPKFWRC